MKRCDWLLSVFLIFSACPAVAGTTADSLFQAALTLPDTVGLDARVAAFKQVVSVDPDCAPAHHQLALLYIRQGTPETRQSAQFALNRAIEIDPNNLEYQLTQGDLLHEQGRFANARDQFKKILKKYPENVRAHYAIGDNALDEYLLNANAVTGEKFFLDGFYQDAETHLRYSIERDPKFRDGYYLDIVRLGLGT